MDFISSILQSLLNILFNFTGDIGIAIVIITLLVKVLLMPLSIKQKVSMRKQQDLAEKMNEIKEKYKNNSKELEAQLQKYSKESVKGMLGCATLLLQMPVIYSLYRTFLNMPHGYSSILIPWINNLNMPDNLFIIPCIYTLTMLAPNLINYIPYFKASSQALFNKQTLVTTVIMSVILTVRTPVSIGIYFITSSIYSFIEEIFFKIYIKQKNKIITN